MNNIFIFKNSCNPGGCRHCEITCTINFENAVKYAQYKYVYEVFWYKWNMKINHINNNKIINTWDMNDYIIGMKYQNVFYDKDEIKLKLKDDEDDSYMEYL